MKHNIESIAEELMKDAMKMHTKTIAKYKHPSVEFTCCRIAEEVGELISAATSRSKERDFNRSDKMWDEATDSIAMVLRLLHEWPNGLLSESHQVKEETK